MRFRKSFKLAPGIRWNISGSGSSFTFGPRGASIGVGKRGAYLNAGVPGTGLYVRQKVGGSQASQSPLRAAQPTATRVDMTCGVKADGTLFFIDEAGNAMPDRIVDLAKKQNKETIFALIQQMCDSINEEVDALGCLHHETLDCQQSPTFVAQPFTEDVPSPPIDQLPGFFTRLFKNKREAMLGANTDARARFDLAVSTWHQRKLAHEHAQDARQVFIESDILHDTAAMERFLEESLQDINWPRETLVAFEIRDRGGKVLLDVDLPEIEDMPDKKASVPSRGLKLSVKELTASRVQKLYAEHVHGILFRLLGETFATLPTVQTVVTSGFTQRSNRATGHIQDDYVISVRAQRSKWEEMDFANLASIDVVEALNRHDIVRSVQRSGKLSAITPFAE